jgi:hypothetical protein
MALDDDCEELCSMLLDDGADVNVHCVSGL